MNTRDSYRGRWSLTFSGLLVGALLAVAPVLTSAADSTEQVAPTLFEFQPGELLVSDGTSLKVFDTHTGSHSLVPMPNGQQPVAAVTTNRLGRLYLASPGTGIWVSDDRGQSWASRNSGLSGHAVAALTVHARQPDTVYAYLPGDGIYRSQNAGRAWELMDGGPEAMSGPFIHTDMPDSMETGWLFVATRQGVGRSMDCFCLWRDAGALGGGVTSLTYDPRHPSHVYVLRNGQLQLSTDGGEQWSRPSPLAIAAKAIAMTRTGQLFALAAEGGVYKRDTHSADWKRIAE